MKRPQDVCAGYGLNGDEGMRASELALAKRGDIAVVGMAVRVPGAHDAATFWSNLRSGLSAIRKLDADDLNLSGYIFAGDQDRPMQLHPLSKHLTGLPARLTDAGYTTAAFHGYEVAFWNRDVAFPAYGFKELYFQEAYPGRELSEFFQIGRDEMTARQLLKRNVRFDQHNLVQDNNPSGGPFDIIFCRNVMIYFDQALKEKVVKQFWENLAEGGFFIIGYYDAMPEACKQYFEVYDYKTRIYRKRALA